MVIIVKTIWRNVASLIYSVVLVKTILPSYNIRIITKVKKSHCLRLLFSTHCLTSLVMTTSRNIMAEKTRFSNKGSKYLQIIS